MGNMKEDSLMDVTGALSIMIRINSCRDVLVADRVSSDPYVEVYLGDTELNQTKHIRKTLNPVYDETCNAAFVLNISVEELRAYKGLQFRVKDWNRIKKNKDLGSVRIPAKKIVGFGKRTTGEEFLLEPPKGSED